MKTDNMTMIEAVQNGNKAIGMKRFLHDDYIAFHVDGTLRWHKSGKKFEPNNFDILATDWKLVEKKQEPVSAEEWVDKFFANNLFNVGYEAIRKKLIKVFKAGGKNRDLLYAELFNGCWEYFINGKPMTINGFKSILEKIKKHLELE